MSKKLNSILIGIFFIMIGVLYLLRDALPVSYNYLLISLLGIELLISGIFGTGIIPLIFGTYITYWGVLHMLPLDKLLISALFWSMFFFAPAFIFFVIFLRRKKRWQLTLMLLFAMLGANVMLDFLTGIDIIGCLFLCIGIALVLDYILGFTYMYMDRLQLGIIFIAVGMMKIIDFKVYLGYVLPIIFIWAGLIICFKTLNKRG